MNVSERNRTNGVVSLFFGVPLVLVGLHTLLKVARRLSLSSSVGAMGMADNSLSRWLMPPHEAAVRIGIQPGMIAMEIRPGSGTYAMAAAQRLGVNGRLVIIDPHADVVERMCKKIRQENFRNMEVRQAEINQLPYSDDSFDLLYMNAVIGDVSDPVRAMKECRRVLSKNGTLVFTENLLDPNYTSANSLVKLAKKAGFRLKKREGSFLAYTLTFEKDPQVIY